MIALCVAVPTFFLTYQPLENGNFSAGPGAGPGKGHHVVRAIYTEGGPFSYRFSLFNHGPLGVTIVGIDPHIAANDMLADPYVLIDPEDAGFNQRGTRFVPFSFGAGDDVWLSVHATFANCERYTPEVSNVYVDITTNVAALRADRGPKPRGPSRRLTGIRGTILIAC